MQMLPCRPFEEFISDFGFGDNNKYSDPTYLDFINVRAAALKSNDGTYRNCPLTFKQGKNSGERPADAEDIITKKKRKTTATALFDDEYAPIAHMPAAAATAGDARATMFPSPWSDAAAAAPAPTTATIAEPQMAAVSSDAHAIAQAFAKAKEDASDNASDMHARFDTLTQGNKALSASTDGKIDKNCEEMQKLIKGLATTLKDGPSSDSGSLSSVHVKLGVQSTLLQNALETMKKSYDEQLAECKTQLNANIEYGKAQNKALKDGIAELKLTHAGELKTKDDHCKSLLDAKDVLIGNMTADMAELKVSNGKLTTDLDDERDAHAAAILEHRAQITKAQNDAEGKKSSININIKTELSMKEQIGQLKQRGDNTQESNQKLEAKLAALKKEYRVLSKENEAKSITNVQWDAANNVLKRDNQYLNVDKAALQKELTALKAKVDSQTNTITRFSAENMALRGSNLTCENVAKATIKEIFTDYQDISKALAAAVKQIAVLEAARV